MKKILCFLIILIMCVGMCIPANATEENCPLTELLIESQNAGGLVPELDPSRLPDDVPSVEGKPVLVMLRNLNWEHAAKLSPEEAVARCYEEQGVSYVLLDGSNTIIYAKNSDEQYESGKFETRSDFIGDIMSADTVQSFLGNRHTIQNMICFKEPYRYRILVYYMTDGGVFVRYYSTFSAEDDTLEYSLEDFQSKAEAYYSFINSYEYLYDEDGNYRTFNDLSFSAYTAMPEIHHQRYAHPPLIQRDSFLRKCTIGAIILLTVGPLAFFLVHHIRKRN